MTPSLYNITVDITDSYAFDFAQDKYIQYTLESMENKINHKIVKL